MTVLRAWLLCLVFAVACGDSDASGGNDSGNGGSAASAGSAGDSGAGGDDSGAGGGGSGGSGGSSGVGGDSGNDSGAGEGGADGGADAGGIGGAGGAPSELNECETDDDCKLAGDCCHCAAIAKDADEPPSCRAACEQDKCTELGVSAVCGAGRCIFDASCDDSEVACLRTPPECPPGEQAIVKGDCWGDCVDVRDCLAVKSCDACTADQACASVGPMLPLLQCWDVAPECDGKASCECMGDDICAPVSCSDESSLADEPVDFGCFCLVC